ncbi:MAG: AAA family ATPase [Candidatus Altiarchaeales archaeon]|nr:MAG: AAA family ATPase [Candidatus Altiarchaeales archaeon]
MKELKPLPIGIQTFKDIIEGGYLYIDKTRYIYEMVKAPKGVFFLSRPRRFGKSLLISTLAEIFKGNKELFKGLWIYDSNYKWKKHPIVRFDFSLIMSETPEELKELIKSRINEIAEVNEIELKEEIYTARFRELLRKLIEKSGGSKVVILIDEYDKPIIDHIEEVEIAVKMREILKSFYTIIKGMDEYIRFVLLTGVSKFSKAGVFSGLNNLEDITMANRYATMLGITQEELEKYFEAYIEELGKAEGLSREETLGKILEWYNGYCFSRNCERVYNPFSVLRLFKEKAFTNYWFESGTPSFLIKLMREKDFDVTRIPMEVKEAMFTVYEVDRLEVIPLLFQTGYLTISGYDKKWNRYKLDYPNKEVKESFTDILLREYTEERVDNGMIDYLKESIEEGDIKKFFEILEKIFHQIPYDIRVKAERYYQSIFYLIFVLIGVDIETEVRTDVGRIDTVIKYGDKIYIFEFKIGGRKEEAIEQIKEKRYWERYEGESKDIVLIGAGFKIERKEGEKAIEYEAEKV